MKAEASLLMAMALAYSSNIGAQTAAVPPARSSAGIEEMERNAQQDLVKDGVLAMPGAIVRGSAWLNSSLQLPGSVKMLQSAGQVDRLMSGIGRATDTAEVAGQEGWNGLMREGAQAVIETAVEKPFDALTSMAARRAIGAGMSAAAASAGVGIAFTAGNLGGAYLRDSPRVASGLGLAPGRTIGDYVDDGYFLITPDFVKEWASGTPQVDTESRAWQLEQQQRIRNNRRQAMFNQIQSENAEQLRQIDAARAAAQTPAGAVQSIDPRLHDPSAITQMLRDALALQKGSGIGAAALSTQACKLDPNTGCHPGHDEKSHPGGCKCGR